MKRGDESGHPPPFLAVKFTSPRPAVILNLCWWLSSPLSAQWSSSTPSGAKIHPSLPSGHPGPLLAVNFTPLHPAVTLHPWWWPTSPLSTWVSRGEG